VKLTGQYDYQYFRASKYFQLDPVRIQELADIVKSYNPIGKQFRILDVGCGLGALVKLLRKDGIEAWGTDSAEALKEIWKEDYFILAPANKQPFPNKMFDLVFSSDFFEHLKEEEIEPVKKEMLRVKSTTGKVVARIAFEEVLNERQKLYHLTNKPKEWWVEKLKGVDIV